MESLYILEDIKPSNISIIHLDNHLHNQLLEVMFIR